MACAEEEECRRYLRAQIQDPFAERDRLAILSGLESRDSQVHQQRRIARVVAQQVLVDRDRCRDIARRDQSTRFREGFFNAPWRCDNLDCPCREARCQESGNPPSLQAAGPPAVTGYLAAHADQTSRPSIIFPPLLIFTGRRNGVSYSWAGSMPRILHSV